MSSRRSRSGGTWIGTTLRRKKRSSRNRPRGDLRLEVLVRRRDARARRRAIGLLAADARDDALLEHAQHLGLRGQAHVADLVEEERAAVAPARTCPPRSATAPVNEPFTWPNSSLSISSAGIAAQLTSTNGLVRARREPMNRARDELLAGAVLAGDQHARRRSARPARSGRGARGSRSCRPTIS